MIYIVLLQEKTGRQLKQNTLYFKSISALKLVICHLKEIANAATNMHDGLVNID